MKRIIIFIIVLIVTAGAVFLTFNKSEYISSKSNNKTFNGVHMVNLLKNKADPDIVIVKVGEYVQFNAKDGKEHNLSQGSGNAVDENHAHAEKGLESGIFKGDEAYKIQFKKVGIYAFHDHFNPDTYIRIIVDDKK